MNPLDSHDMPIRVRYAETDQMGVVHHANYFVYFEMGRTEMLRQTGISYRSLEERGFLLVVARIGCKFKEPARYDDELILRTSIKRVTAVRVDHGYLLIREGRTIAEGESTLACVDRNGRLQALPPELAPSRE